MNKKLEIIEDCMIEIHRKTLEKYNKPMVVTINELSEKIQYNFAAKAYDILYGLDPEEFETSEIIRILNANNITYSYRGEVKNSSKMLLFGANI